MEKIGETLALRVNGKGPVSMATEQEQAIEWIAHSTLSTSLKEAAIVIVPTIPTKLAGMPYCPACESVLCEACGHCHMLDIGSFSQPLCPLDNDDMGASCAAWWQAFLAVQTIQMMNEESEE